MTRDGQPIEMERVLFLQKPEVLTEQRAGLDARFQRELPGVVVDFSGGAAEVPAGVVYDAVVSPTLPWLPEALARTGGYRWIHFLSAGVEKIWEMDFAREGVVLTRSSGVHGPPMSEYAIGAMLHFAKRFDRFIEQSRRAEWSRAWLDELTGRTLMMLGLGHVGTMVARRARAFDMRVVGVQRTPRACEDADEVVALTEAPGLLDAVDFLVVCLPLTEETRGLVDDSFLARLKPGAVLVDISRGGVVRADAVLAALDDGCLRGAALDVFAEQPLPADSPLWGRPDILLTPHVSGTSPHYMERALDVFIDNVSRLQAGQPPATPVDLDAGY